MRDDDESLAFLLSGQRLSNADHDAILERVLPPTRDRRRLRWLHAGEAMLAAGVLATLVVLFEPHRATPPAGFVAKGVASAVELRANCADRASGVCKRGDALVFEVNGAASGGWLAAFAEAPSGERIWYFPTASGHLSIVPPNDGHFLVKEVARLGAEHSPGKYRAHLYLLDSPVDRAALLKGSVPAQAETVLTFEVTL